MKTSKLVTLAALFLAAVGSMAQNSKDTTSEYVVVEHDYQVKTLFGGSSSNGFYLGYDLGFSKMKNADLIETGGRLAWVIDHSMGIGLFGSGFLTANDIEKEINGTKNNVLFAGGYGGIMFEPILFPKSPVHLSFPLMLGVGGAGYSTYSDSYEYDNNYYYDEHTLEYNYEENSDGDAFLVLKPGVELELNVVKFMRVGLGVHYRYLYGFDIAGFEKDEFNGFNANIAFKVGKF